jgi:choline-sulfatase
VTRPNILWIQTDEQRADSLGCTGERPVRTPNIDALAERGVRFANHFVQSPVCVPSRVCELTGRYAHQTGVFDNGVQYAKGTWPDGLTTFPGVFARHGYRTANLGKWHTPSHKTWQENWDFQLFWDYDKKRPRSPYGDVAWFFGLGEDYDEAEHELLTYRLCGHSPVVLSGRYPDLPGGVTPRSHLADRAIDWLRDADSDRPFLLRVSFLDPHTPVLPSEPWYSMYAGEDWDWDVPDDASLESRPRYELTDARRERYRELSYAERCRMRASYYGLVSEVDHHVGRLVDALRNNGQLDRTIVVCTSDHGCMLGEHGQYHKSVYYDHVTRVPFLICGPDVSAGTREDLTQVIDLGPTLLDLAGLSAPDSFRSESVFADGFHRDHVIAEIANRRDDVLRRRSWIRTDRYSLDWTSEINDRPTAGPDEEDGKLLDVMHDPLGHYNLFYAPDHRETVDALQRRFREHLSDEPRPMQVGADGIIQV